MVLSGVAVLWIFLVLNGVHGLCTMGFYTKTGRAAWSAFVPFYNVYSGLQMIRKPVWWSVLFYIPVINNVMILVLWAGILRHFGLDKRDRYIQVFATLGLYFFVLSRRKDLVYRPVTEQKQHWVSSLLFAVVVASVIRFFAFEPYTIPTSSMEKTLRVGDFLFVNKYVYGIRVPVTLLSLPLLHDKIPVLGFPAYLDWVRLPYLRLPALREVVRGDIIVFNYPIDDAPLDKKQNYVKRCVAVPGDTLRIEGTRLLINGREMPFPVEADPQFLYNVDTKGVPLNRSRMKERYEITDRIDQVGTSTYRVPLSKGGLSHFSRFNVNRFVLPEDYVEPRLFAETGAAWNGDYYGAIRIPAKGDRVVLTSKNSPLYRRIITHYEGHLLEEKEGLFYIDGVETKEYTVMKDYYWAMGDNRHNSLDSRYWGFVPRDHIFGSPSMIWMSWNSAGRGLLDKIRWDRLLLVVDNEEHTHLYVPVGVLFLVLFGVNRYRRKKKKEANKSTA